MTTAIEIEGLTKDYETGFWVKKKTRALDGLNLSVPSGQIFGFLGGNGAGKTTTIKILMSLMFPTAGSARILGCDISDTSMHSRIGYCPENPYFYDYLTPNELMNYFGRLLGLDLVTSRERSKDLLGRVGLDERDWNKQLRKFSKGMLQRIGLAQALLNEPELVFLDEPMSGLDPIGRREIRELISGLRDKGVTVFMSTHILSDIEALCDNVAILRRGRLAATGKLDELLSSHGEKQTFEVSVKGVAAEAIAADIGEITGAKLSVKASGAVIEVQDEKDLDKVLAVSRSHGGSLVSVQPVRQSLEELFVRETD